MILDDALDGTRLQRFATDLGMFIVHNDGDLFTVYRYSQRWVRPVEAFYARDLPGFSPRLTVTPDRAVAIIDRYFDRVRSQQQQVEEVVSV